MTFDLVSARERVGLASSDTSQDATLTAALAASVGTAEGYLGRGIENQSVVEVIFAPTGDLYLRRYPIVGLTSLVYEDSSPVNPDSYRLDSGAGRVLFRSGQWPSGSDIEASYSGGYVTYPADLEQALWLIFDMTYASISDPGLNAGAIESITLADVGTVRYGPGTAGATGMPVDGSSPIGTIASLLSPYRRVLA